MDSAGGYFSINGIPVLYFETDVQAQAIEKAWDTWLRMHTIKLRDLRDLLFMESTWLLSNEDSKGIRKVQMGKGKGWSKDDLKYITLNSKSLNPHSLTKDYAKSVAAVKQDRDNQENN